MRISKNRVLDFLRKCQIEKGGYRGGDVVELAKSLLVSPQALRKRINYWITNDPAFKQLRYLGKQFVPLTIDDFILIDQRLKEKPLGRMYDLLREINDNRQKQPLEVLTLTALPHDYKKHKNGFSRHILA